ncbi:MAG TPA: ABC transporter ATP-binding protein [Clostridiales bacterium]|nr:ABC transporter ATP-binding protein [Clostridiales bacterium]
MGPGPGHGMMMSNEKAKDFKGTMKRLSKSLSAYKIGFIIVFMFAIGSTIFAIIGPTILGNATTEIFEGLVSKIKGGSGIDFTKLKNIMITIIILYVSSTVLSLIQGFIMTDISQKISYKFRRDISEKTHRMPMNYFDTTKHGEVLSRITNDVDTLGQSLNQSLTQLITSVVTIVGVLVMMIRISWSMTTLALLIVPISLLMVTSIIKKSQKYFNKQQEYLGELNGQVEEVYAGHGIVKVFNKEEDLVKTFGEKNEQLYETAWKSQFLSGLMPPIMMFVGNLGYVGVSILGGYLAIRGKLKIGQIQSFIQYVRSFTQPINQLAQVANMFQSTAAAAERVYEYLNEDEELADISDTVKTDLVKGNVEFKHVKFGYNEDEIIINDFSAIVKPGQKVAIVGPTGAGKSTMIKLLMRFYDINSGEILIDSHNIIDFAREDLRKMFGMVLQDAWLFNGTIMDNIRYGRLDASDEEVIEAAKAAHAHRFITTLPDGYNMVLNEEVTNVSEGQKQLLTIARAILAKPKMLILDEATSSVDTRTEIRIQKAMDNLMKDRTSFIIAHRLSTIRDADLILVMNEGDIIEQGSHEELIALGKFYANLYNSQFEKIA